MFEGETTGSLSPVKGVLTKAMARLKIAEGIYLDEGCVETRFTRSGGPGGQKVNTSDSAVQLFLELSCAGFPDDMVDRLHKIAGGRIGADGRLMIACSTHRSQARNRKLAMARLVRLLRRAAAKPKKRKRTRPSRAAREKRLRNKRRKSEKKRMRRKPDPTEH